MLHYKIVFKKVDKKGYWIVILGLQLNIIF